MKPQSCRRIRTGPKLLVLLLPLTIGCGALDEDGSEALDEEDLLVASVTNESEDLFAGDFVSDPDLDPENVERPLMTGSCDAGGHFQRLRAFHLRGGRGDRLRARLRVGPHPRLVHLGWIYDADGDGKLSDAERAEMLADFTARCEARRARLLADFDANHNGVLDDGELATAREAARACRQARRDEFLMTVDSNHDGRLSFEERRAAHAARLAQFAMRRAAIVAEFDLNKDGALDAAERSSARAAIRERIRAGGERRCS